MMEWKQLAGCEVASVAASPGHLRCQCGSGGRWWRCALRHSGMRPFVVLLGLFACAAAVAQQPLALELTLRDGRVLAAQSLVGSQSSGYEVVSGGERHQLAASDVLFVHGAPALPVDLPVLHLQGGEVVRAALTGGDAGGNRVEVVSPCFGQLNVAVDRLQAVVVGREPPERFVLPDGVDEALFVPAAIGFDIQGGSLFQFGAEGVRFQPEGREAPRWFAVREFVALRLRGASSRAKPAEAELWTRAGDHVGVDAVECRAEGVRCRLEGGAEVDVRWGDVAGLGWRAGVTWLSDLAPSAVRESGFDGDVVHPWQRDLGVTGEPLSGGGHSHGKGLGVHSRSRLSFAVPPGAGSFWTRVSLSSSASALPVVANVDVRVLVNDTLVFQANLTPASAPGDTGLVAVKAGDTLTLEVDFGRGRDLGDRVDWLSPLFLPTNPRRP